MNVEFHIEELVLHGFTPADRETIATALRQELHRLLVERGPPHRLSELHNLERLDAGSFRTTSRATPASMGRGAALALHSNLPW